MTLPSRSLLDQAAALARTRQCSTLQALADLQELPYADYLETIATALELPLLDAEALSAVQPDFGTLSYTDAIERKCLAWMAGDGWQVACVEPFDPGLRSWLGRRLQSPYALSLVDMHVLNGVLGEMSESQRPHSAGLGEAKTAADADVEHISLQSLALETSPAVRLLSSTLFDSLKSEASDIHIECTGHGVALRYRIDGVLIKAGEVEGDELAQQLISRLKVLAELDIAERRTPQDGRFQARIDQRNVDFRVSIMPSHHGEDAVVRILDKGSRSNDEALSLTSLGFDAHDRELLLRLARQPYGMVLVTGPTGSGKTTTLYALINAINSVGEKIITIEDPIEYQLAGALQIPVNDKKGLSFARGLRSILRHDPDRILVGEIRDSETAQIAVQSALTGHAVYTSVHANNAFDVIGRFIHMGIEPYSFVSALNGILAQRLLRTNCPHCARPVPVDAEAAAILGSGIDTIYRGTGCALCRGTGYKGRKAIAEVLVMDDDLRQIIIEQRPASELKQAARQRGMRNLREAAVNCVREGLTTIEEINRVTFVG